MEIKLGTRDSLLASTQSTWIKNYIESQNSNIHIELEYIKTQGDLNQNQSFSRIGSQGLFTKELDLALLDHRIDLAVHSLKDLPSSMPKGIEMIAVSSCIDERDAWISTKHSFEDAKKNALCIGTASVRRSRLIEEQCPKSFVKMIRGNVDTRLKKLHDGECDVLLLASAGLKRLGIEHHIREHLQASIFVPAIGQGRLALCIRSSDTDLGQKLQKLFSPRDLLLAQIEKKFLASFGGGCSIPLGAIAKFEHDHISFSAYYYHEEKKEHRRQSIVLDPSQYIEDLQNFSLKLRA
ncbi:MAG: hydroxymethylbilane synthase [Bdellovibrionales bacterium]|nr:hydroxymethylbilane synthase [Bdellovibrionales bacterium]